MGDLHLRTQGLRRFKNMYFRHQRAVIRPNIMPNIVSVPLILPKQV